MSTATEIVTMKTVDGVTPEQFLDVVSRLEKKFHSKQPGFMDTELLRNDKTGEWIIIQHWDSLDSMRTASSKMFKNPDTSEFVESLDAKSVKMLMLPQLGTWS